MKTRDAIAHFGSKNRLAQALGITRSAISHWGDVVPQQRQYELERLTGRKLRAEWPAQPRAA